MNESRTYKIIISEKAKQMLGTHIRFLAQINKSVAIKKKSKIIKEIRSLAQMPHRFPFFEEMCIPKNKYHKMFVENWYIVLYQIKDDKVYVEYIIDCRTEYSWLVK